MRCLFLGFFVFVMIWLFQPFEASDSSQVFLLSTWAGSFTVLVLIGFNKFLFIKYKNYFNSDYWTVGREITWSIINMLLVIMSLIVFVFLFGQIQLAARQLLTFLLLAILFGIVPIFVATLLKQSSLKKQYHKNAELLNAKLNSRALLNVNLKSETLLELQSDTSSMFRIKIQDLLYMHVFDREIELFYAEGEVVLKTVLTISRDNLAVQTQTYSELLDCHKDYIVNLSKLIHVSGNARGYYLHLIGIKELIPVSHFFDAELKERLSKY
jgi:DNA-binding LytR/AlgR family response regulator